MAALKPEICRDVISERRIIYNCHCVKNWALSPLDLDEPLTSYKFS